MNQVSNRRASVADAGSRAAARHGRVPNQAAQGEARGMKSGHANGEGRERYTAGVKEHTLGNDKKEERENEPVWASMSCQYLCRSNL